MFEFVDVAEQCWSGYKQSQYGWMLYSLARSHKPKKAVEIGVLQGYSTMFIAAALRDNSDGAILEAWDMFDDYEFHNAKMEDTQATIDVAMLTDHVRLYQNDAEFAFNNYLHNSMRLIDFLHIDISNDGGVYRWVINRFGPLMSPHGIIVLEGGTLERDRVEWMIKYNKEPIHPMLKTLRWKHFTYLPFPGLTILRHDPVGKITDKGWVGEVKVY